MNQSAEEMAVREFVRHPAPVAVDCGVQHYAWGDPDFIPRLTGVSNRDRKPFAELWIGAHPNLPSKIRLDGTTVPLPVLLDEAAETVMGPADAGRFEGRLPFLLKILAAAQPLSIQAHPDKRQAREGFDRENREGVPLDAPTRNYRDDNHKPELIAALTDFYALRGFRPLDEIGALQASVPEFAGLLAGFRPTRDALTDLYGRIMRLGQDELDAVLTPLLRRLNEANEQRAYTKEEREYWVLTADAVFSGDGVRDRGLFSIYLLNLVRLEPGEAMYLPAGELHAYLEGSGVEIMANSNNVLRGGLTPKHTDVDELLRILTFDAGRPHIIKPDRKSDEAGRTVYDTPSQEFVLSRLTVTAGRHHDGGSDHGIQLGVVTGGGGVVSTGQDDLEIRRGDVFLIPTGLDYRIFTDGHAVVFIAGVPGT